MIWFLLVVSAVVLFIGYLTAISSKDLIRLLISLELMFGSVFLALIPLFTTLPSSAFGVAVITIFTSSSELLILIIAIMLIDKEFRTISVETISSGGDRVD
ncbi:F420H(2):quinone oxidoreductase [Archaeoglobales archaeon]|nr:MAG: F420H(2):quinone oxidoreductase [Archaeoglobales archaeon]